uniref:Uncharacterized protein n=1 Tax=mine drainage metagenome TaxID=410659 RepID=E6Q4U9_9ZZZZ
METWNNVKISSLTGGIVLASAVALLGSATARAAEHPCADKASKWQRTECREMLRSAPGDQYFGRLKMSYLGINNTFRDDAIRAGAYTTNSGLISSVNFADEALRDWAHRYPGDPQLARSYFLAVQAMSKLYVQPEQQRAYHYMLVLVKKFPHTYFGKVMKESLARGFTEHWYAPAQPCGTPGAASPMATPSDPNVHVDLLASPCTPVPAATPSSSPTP